MFLSFIIDITGMDVTGVEWFLRDLCCLLFSMGLDGGNDTCLHWVVNCVAPVEAFYCQISWSLR